MSDARQRLLIDARRVERAGSLVMLLGVALGALGVLGAAGAAVVSKSEVPVKAAIGVGGLVYGVLVAFVVVVQGLVLRTFGGYVQLRADEPAATRPAPRTAPVAASGAPRPTERKPARPAQPAAGAAAPAARTAGVAVAKPTASGLRPPVKTG